jgi:hypothetical protein
MELFFGRTRLAIIPKSSQLSAINHIQTGLAHISSVRKKSLKAV